MSIPELFESGSCARGFCSKPVMILASENVVKIIPLYKVNFPSSIMCTFGDQLFNSSPQIFHKIQITMYPFKLAKLGDYFLQRNVAGGIQDGIS